MALANHPSAAAPGGAAAGPPAPPGTAGAPTAPGGLRGVLASPWLVFAMRRLGGVALVLTVLVTLTFAIVQLMPGDPARVAAGNNATPEQLTQMRHDLGLDKSVAAQFGDYVAGLFRGDLGHSFQTEEKVSDIITDRLPYTAELALLGVAVVLVVGVPLGMAIAVACRDGRRRRLDGGFTLATGLVGSTPEYVLGTLLVLVIGIQLEWLPVAGAATPSALVLPVVAISLGPVCTIARIVRRETSVVLAQDYLRTARGRRLPARRLYLRHALPNLLTSTLTLAGLLLAGLLGGTVVIESVFAWPGLGTRVVEAITLRDLPVIQGVVLVLGVLACLLNLLIDIVLGLLDPRTLSGKAAS
ncbi:ABC transporter permease [Yinghuangia soli]|uniref:ABC transporter permease n=1 Tax=Yinghuangia soli TaxID=2908204 RepID=A0AA41U3C7_9ACTN|nr:ABC transporter permease [Yinghuangia soli]MCF2527939.1 ABC transporter permease [Yinghuangia soli]